MQHNHPDAHFYDTLDKRFGVVGYLYRSLRAVHGDKLDAPRLLARKWVREIARWLRSAEACARMVLLEIARTLTLEPAQACAPRAKRAFPNAARMATFALAPPLSRPRHYGASAPGPLPDYTIDDAMFGADWRAAAKIKRAAWNAQSGRGVFQRAAGAAFPPASDKAPAPARALPKDLHNGGVLRRFLGLARVLEAPLVFAARLARRLAGDARVAERALRLPPYADKPPHFPDTLLALFEYAAAPPKGRDDG